MKRKNLLAALLLLAMAFSLLTLTACGKGGEQDDAPALPTAEPTAEPEEEAPTYDWEAIAALSALREKYAGYWYGWFSLSNGSGDFAAYDDDVIASFDFGAINDYSLEARIQVTGLSDYALLADLTVQFAADGSWTFDNAEILGVPATEITNDFLEDLESMLILFGEAENDDSAFSFSIGIRPWGMTWEDAEEEYPDDIPANYYDWYLPQLDSSDA